MRKKDIRCVLRHGLIVVTILLCLFAVCATPAMAVDVYEEVDNYDMLSTHIRIANENPSNSYTIVVMEGFDVTERLTITGDVTLTTNETQSNTLTFNAGADAIRMFNVIEGGKLTIRANGLELLTLRGSSESSETLVFVDVGSRFLLENGTLTGSTSESASAVRVYGGEFVMNGGTISGNSITDSGGAVYVAKEGTFEMNGGSISGNSCCGVYISNQRGGGTFRMTGGTISDNSIGVYFMSGEFFLAGSPQISENSNYDIYVGTNQYITLSEFEDGWTGKIVIRCSEYSSPKIFARGVEGVDISAYKSFFTSTDSQYFVIYNEEDNTLRLSLPIVNDPTPPGQSVWIAAPVNSKLGSGVLDNPNGGKINFPEGFPFKSVTINQAGEVTQSSPSSVESDFPVSDTRQILASADITANPSLPSDGSVTIEFTVPIEKIPDGYTVGVYHGVVKGHEESAAQDAYDAGSKAWEASNEVYELIQECNSGLKDPSFNLEAAYYALQEAITKTKEAIKAAKDAAVRADFAGDKEAEKAALDAAVGAAEVLHFGEDMMAMIVEKLGYVPQSKTDVYAWKAEKVVETGRSDGLIHYAVEVNGLSPFIIVIEQGGAKPATSQADVVPPLDIEPAATPTESPVPLLGVLAGLGAVVWLRRR